MTDRYADIRAALDAGPTPGPWFTHRSLGLAVATVGIHRIVSDAEPVADPTSDIRYIAACHPEAIRALLAERDALRATIDELIDAAEGRFFGNGNDPDGTLRSVVAAAKSALAQEQGGSDDNQD